MAEGLVAGLQQTILLGQEGLLKTQVLKKSAIDPHQHFTSGKRKKKAPVTGAMRTAATPGLKIKKHYDD